MKTNETTSQLQKRLIGLPELVPTDQEATPAIEPREQPFHHPTSRCFARLQAVGGFLGRLLPLVLVRIEPHMGLKATLVQLAIDGIKIVGRIQTQVLRILHRWLRALKGERIQGGEQQS